MVHGLHSKLLLEGKVDVSGENMLMTIVMIHL